MGKRAGAAKVKKQSDSDKTALSHKQHPSNSFAALNNCGFPTRASTTACHIKMTAEYIDAEEEKLHLDKRCETSLLKRDSVSEIWS